MIKNFLTTVFFLSFTTVLQAVFTQEDKDHFIELISQGKKDAIETLLNKSTPYQKEELVNQKHNKALATAIRGRFLDIVNLLLQHGANPLENEDRFQTSMLHLAAREGSIEITQALLNTYANPNVYDKTLLRPLDVAKNKKTATSPHSSAYTTLLDGNNQNAREEVVKLLESKTTIPEASNEERILALDMMSYGAYKAFLTQPASDMFASTVMFMFLNFVDYNLYKENHTETKYNAKMQSKDETSLDSQTHTNKIILEKIEQQTQKKPHKPRNHYILHMIKKPSKHKPFFVGLAFFFSNAFALEKTVSASLALLKKYPFLQQ